MKLKILISFFLVIQLFFCTEEGKISILNCSQSARVVTLQNLDLSYEEVCLKCQKGFILSSNYKTCYNVEETINQETQYLKLCIRLGLNNKCAEAVYGIELLSNGEMTYTEEQAFGDRCAIVSKDYKECLYPRLEHTLQFSTNKISLHTDHKFCAIYDQNKDRCKDYFPYFIRSKERNIPAYVGSDFLNPNMIIQEISSSEKIVCKDGYDYIDLPQIYHGITLNGRIAVGCVKKGFIPNRIADCEQYDDHGYSCLVCKENFSLNKQNNQCEKIDQINCSEFIKIDNRYIVCIQCLPFYRKKNNICEKMNYCKEVSPINSNVCIGCIPNFELYGRSEYGEGYCSPSKQLDMSKCASYGKYDCRECYNKEEYYSSGKDCYERKNSKECKEKYLAADICLSSTTCKEQQYYSPPKVFLPNGFLDNQSTKFIEHEIPISERIWNLMRILEDQNRLIQNGFFKYSDYFSNFNVFNYYLGCVNRKQYPIQHCKKYHPLLDQCYECEEGYNIQFTYQKASNCIKESQNLNIEYCIKYDKNICMECEKGYVSTGKQCIKEYSNCYIQSMTEKKCLQCKTGFGRSYYFDVGNTCQEESKLNPFKTETLGQVFNTISKTTISDEEFPNCSKLVQASIEQKLICQVCHKDFYLVEEKCYTQSPLSIYGYQGGKHIKEIQNFKTLIEMSKNQNPNQEYNQNPNQEYNQSDKINSEQSDDTVETVLTYFSVGILISVLLIIVYRYAKRKISSLQIRFSRMNES